MAAKKTKDTTTDVKRLAPVTAHAAAAAHPVGKRRAKARSSRATGAKRPAPRARRKPAAAARRTARAGAAPSDAATFASSIAPQFDTMLRELRDLKRFVQPPRPTKRKLDGALEESVDSLRRLLSEAFERQMEAVVRELVEVRRELWAGAGGHTDDRLDRLLDDLGVSRFAAEPMNLVDPLIHTVVDERHDADAPNGVVLATVRPGYRSARGGVLCKAAVAINRRS